MLVAYTGPETILPLSSAAAMVTGVALAFWPRLVKFIRTMIYGGIRLLLPVGKNSANRCHEPHRSKMAKPRSEPSFTI
jgi:hypothetical protein